MLYAPRPACSHGCFGPVNVLRHMLWCCSLMSVLEGERKEFEAACEKHEREKQALMEKVQARRATVRGILEAAVLPSAESPAR